jgi:hypothetical protein
MRSVIAIFVLLMVAFSGWGFFIYAISHRDYDGQVIVTRQEGKTIFTLEVDIDVDEIPNMDSLLFKVVDTDNFLK